MQNQKNIQIKVITNIYFEQLQGVWSKSKVKAKPS